VLDAAPHIWHRMAMVLVDRLYDPSLSLFRETWGTSEGRCWYWNTEQGEAAQIVVYLENSTLLATVLDSYKKYLTYDNGSVVWLFSRYTPCKSFRVLSTDPTDFSIGNLIVNTGGDLAGARTDNGNYTRAIALSLDVYKDYTNIYEQDKAWPNLWYTANIRGIEVWYLLPGESSDYRGIWDTSDGSLGSGRIVYYNISVGSVANATRVMSDGRLVYTQEFILEPGAPYVKVILKVRNNTTENMSDVRVTLAFDNMDWWRYQVVYLLGAGYFNASTSGTNISSAEREYHFAHSWDGAWQKITDDSGRSWWPSIIYANRPLGVNRALLVLVQGDYDVHFWGYGNLQAPQKDLYGVPAFMDWYYRWLKYEVRIGDLAANETETIEVRIVPMASYAPGLEDLVLDMARHIDSLAGRDWSYAVTTGTGAFKGVALASVRLASLDDQYYDFARKMIDSAGVVMKSWGWRVSTRVLASYIEALLILYEYSHNQTLLEEAREEAEILLSAQVRDPGDPRDGGFLDLPPPFGAAAYLDVGSEAAHALLMLYNATGDPRYREAVDYWLGSWFHYDEEKGWYYYRFKSFEEAPSPQWYIGLLGNEPPYAQGYFLQALSSLYWYDRKLLASANTIWRLLNSQYWVPAEEGASETNVETQSASAAGLKSFLEALTIHMGAGIEYVRGGLLANLSYKRNGSTSILTGETRSPPGKAVVIALYIPGGLIDGVYINGSPAKAVNGLRELSSLSESAYYWDGRSRILYMKLPSNGSFRVSYRTEVYNTSAPPLHTSSSGGTGIPTGSPSTSPSEGAGRRLIQMLAFALIIVLAASILLFRERSRG
jgi:hypothetical protein